MKSGITVLPLMCLLLVTTQHAMSFSSANSRINQMLHQRQPAVINKGNVQLYFHPRYSASSQLAPRIASKTYLPSTASVPAIGSDATHEDSLLECMKNSICNFSKSETFRFLKGKQQTDVITCDVILLLHMSNYHTCH